MEVNQSRLAELIDQLVMVPRGKPAGTHHPVLVVEGRGGSGRTTVLRGRWDRWARRTPTVWVNPRLIGNPARDDLRPVLLAVLLGLSAEVPYYEVKFRRVILAYVAMKEPILDADPGQAVAKLRQRMIEYQDQDNLIGLLQNLLGVVGEAVRGVEMPGGEVVAALSDALAPVMTKRLRRSRWMTKLTWGNAASWFGHQDKGLNWNHEVALVMLSRQAQNEDGAVRRDIDELLVRALLADLRENLGEIQNRPWNALILLDNGDMPAASAFTSALVRVSKQRLNRPRAEELAPDPLVLVTTSCGELAPRLPGPGILRRDEAMGIDAGRWLAIQLGDYTEEQVQEMTQERMWSLEWGSATAAHLIYRFTAGHAGATDLLLRAFDENPDRIDDFGKVLRSRELTTPRRTGELPPTAAEYLLDQLVAGLRSNGWVDELLREDLVTLSAARSRAEIDVLSELVTSANLELMRNSPTLWSTGRVRPPLTEPVPTPPVLPRLVRYLGLRALAERSGDQKPGWDKVFRRLQEAAEDRAGRLHHELALGGTEQVVAELDSLLPQLSQREWLALLDEITCTPDPRATAGAGQADAVAGVVAGQRAIADPQLSDRRVLATLYQGLSNDFNTLARGGYGDAFADRRDYYHRLATSIGPVAQ